MIDLAQKALPCTVNIDGQAFPIETDFRVWLKFSRCIAADDADVRFVFNGELPEPTPSMYDTLMQFYFNPNPCPHGDGGDGEILFDYDADSEFIYSAFFQLYGIDLFTASLHWHQFKALFISITDDTKMGQIMDARGYDGNDAQQIKNRNAWSLPVKLTETEKQKANEFDDYFST